MKQAAYIVPTKAQDQRVRLTKTLVENAEPPERGQRFVRDRDLTGFALRITAQGTKTFVVEKRVRGRNRRIKIGRYGDLTVAQARSRAQQLIGQIALGVDPVEERHKARARGITLNQAYRDYLKARPNLRPRTRDDYDRAIKVVFRDWGARPLHSITRPMVADRHLALGESRGEQAANSYMRVLRAVFSFAIDNYEDGSGTPVFNHNPVLVLTRTRRWYRQVRRKTVIRVHELPAWFQGVESLRESDHQDSLGDTVADLLLFLLFTGLRRSEAMSLDWRNVDLKSKIFTIPRTKNGRPHCLPFHAFVESLLIRRLGAQQNDFVFPGKAPGGRLVEPKRQIQRVAEHSGVAFTPHDLRRTFITIAESINLSPYTIKRLANHSTSGDVTAGYIVTDVERLREPMAQIDRFLVSAIRPERSGKVVQFDGNR